MSKFTSETHKSIALTLLRSVMYLEIGIGALNERKPHCATQAEFYQAEIEDRDQVLQSAHDELIKLFFHDAIEYGKVPLDENGAGFGLTWFDFATTGTSFGKTEAIRLAREEFDISEQDAEWLCFLAGHRLSKPYIEAKRLEAQAIVNASQPTLE